MSLRIDSNLGFSPINIKSSKKILSQTSIQKPDTVEISFGKSAQKTSFLSRLFQKPNVSFDFEEYNTNQPVSDFAKTLSVEFKNKTGINIPASNLVNVMSADEFRAILPTLQADNFQRNQHNIDDGIYCADLDYPSNYSSGKDTVIEIMNKVAIQAEKYAQNQREKGVAEEDIKPFYFALTDRDTLEGTQQAIGIIGAEPEKFKHLKFIPAVKLTYAHPAPTSALGYENSEMLVYGINPFSKTLTKYLDDLIEKRKKMITNFLSEIHEFHPEFECTTEEFIEQNEIKYRRSFAISNLYWRVREYAQGKGANSLNQTATPPEIIWEERNRIFREMGNIHAGSRQSTFVDPSSSYIEQDTPFNISIQEVFKRYSTHFDEKEGDAVSEAENMYKKMIEKLKEESPKPVLALSAPIYLSHYFENEDSKTFPNVVKFIEELKATSDGMLCAFQSITPNYGIDSNLNREKIKNFNSYIRDAKHLDLYEVGGSFDGVMTN